VAVNIEEQLLSADIENTFALAHEAASELERLIRSGDHFDSESGEESDESIHRNQVLAYYVEKLFRDIGILAERLGLPSYCKEVSHARRGIKNFSEINHLREIDIFESEHIRVARKLFSSLNAMTLGRAITGLGVFETVLENTPKIITASGLEPNKESKVSAEVRKVLSFCFTDVVADIPIAKIIKPYKPDIGVMSLMAAAEYKFIDSKAEVKTALDGIYTDMKGYSGNYHWRNFYAVLYMTDAFYTQKEIDAEFRLVKAELSWKPIVVVGKGGRQLARRSPNRRKIQRRR
jgi:hypothetical protein